MHRHTRQMCVIWKYPTLEYAHCLCSTRWTRRFVLYYHIMHAILVYSYTFRFLHSSMAPYWSKLIRLCIPRHFGITTTLHRWIYYTAFSYHKNTYKLYGIYFSIEAQFKLYSFKSRVPRVHQYNAMSFVRLGVFKKRDKSYLCQDK